MEVKAVVGTMDAGLRGCGFDDQGLESRLEVKAGVGVVAAGLWGCVAVASGLCLWGWRFGVGDTLAGKGVIDVGNYIFLLLCKHYPYGRKEGVET